MFCHASAARVFARSAGATWPASQCRFAHAASSCLVSGRVMLRNTSSRRPSSVCNSSIRHRSARGDFADRARQFPALRRSSSISPHGQRRLRRGRRISRRPGSASSLRDDLGATSVEQPQASPRRHDPSAASVPPGVPFATIWPRSMMIAREQAASTSSRMCVEKMIAFVSTHRPNQRPDLMLLVGIEAIGRFVQDQHVRDRG